MNPPKNSARASAIQIALFIILTLISVALVIAATRTSHSPSPEMAPNQRWAPTTAPPIETSQAPVALNPSTTALTEALNLPERQLTLRHPKNWSVGPKRFSNMTELINIPSNQHGRVPITAKIKIRHQNRIDHADALGELVEISKETKIPVTFLTIGGWPAIQRATLEHRQQPDEAPRFPDPSMIRVTTAIAAGDSVIRMDAILPSKADAKLVGDTSAIQRSVAFAVQGNPRDTQRDLDLLKGKVAAAAEATPVVPAGPSAQPSRTRATEPTEGQFKLQTESASGGSGAGASGESGPGASRVFNGGNGELVIVTSPDGKTVIVARQNNWVTSKDGGQTFPFSGSLNFGDGDPSLAAGQSGNYYLAGIRTSGGGCTFPGTDPDPTHTFGYTCTGFRRSTDGGQTFAILGNAVVCPNDSPTTPGTVADRCFPDQEHIAADRFNAAPGGDQVYSTWRNFDATDQDPAIVCSQDSGANWTAPADVDSGFIPRITVGQDGFVYVVYRSGTNIRLNKYSSCANGLAAQPGFPRTISSVTDVACPVPGLDRCNDGNNLSSITAAVDDTNPNHVYAAFAHQTAAGNQDVLVRDSTDGGVTWPAARVVRVNNAVPGVRFMPWVSATLGTAYVSWYDRRAATPCTTPPCAANNDLTDYYVSSARLDSGGNLVAGSELKLTTAADPQCAGGKTPGSAASWPCSTRATADSETCSVQPQLAGVCCDNTQPGCPGSQQPCDFSSGPACPTGETCNGGGGCPKYGDYNGNAAAAGRVFLAWASGVPPSGIAPSGNIDVFFASKVLGDVGVVSVPGNVDFSDTCVGRSSTSTLNVCNTGKANLEVSSISSSNTQFAVTTPTSGYPVVISPDFCFPFQATFTPSSSGAKSGTFTINSDDPGSPAVTVAATGNGGIPQIATLVPNSGDFGDVCLATFKDQPLTISNSGKCDLSVSNVTSSSSEFEVAGVMSYPVVVHPGDSIQVPIRFKPSSLGAKTGTISISSNDPNTATKNVAVSGNTPPGEIRLTGSTDFGDVCPGTLAEKTISICNVGKCNLNVSSAMFSPACSDFTIVNNPFPATVSPDFCMGLTIRFTPTSPGPKSCNLVINSDDPGNPAINMTVTANTPAASIDVPPDQTFAPTVIQSTASCSARNPFPISNTGTCNLKITNVTIEGANASDYSIAGLPSFPIILEPGHIVGDGNLKLVFSPTAIARERSASVSVTYESDPIAHTTTTVTRMLCGEGVNTGARVLVTAGGIPINTVEKIQLQRITANRNRDQLDTNDVAQNPPLQTVTPALPCAPFQFHREYGTVSNPIQLLPGSYQVTVQATIGKKKQSKTVGFEVDTCGFNSNINIGF